ncbi:MAG: hypothetical protein ACFB0C_20705, partial [Leptolyngbyaceae cyanobacterium]
MAAPSKKTPSSVWRQKLASGLERLGHPIILAVAAAGAMVLGGRALGLFQGPELAAYDQFLRLRPGGAADDRLLVVGITE